MGSIEYVILPIFILCFSTYYQNERIYQPLNFADLFSGLYGMFTQMRKAQNTDTPLSSYYLLFSTCYFLIFVSGCQNLKMAIHLA